MLWVWKVEQRGLTEQETEQLARWREWIRTGSECQWVVTWGRRSQGVTQGLGGNGSPVGDRRGTRLYGKCKCITQELGDCSARRREPGMVSELSNRERTLLQEHWRAAEREWMGTGG